MKKIVTRAMMVLAMLLAGTAMASAQDEIQQFRQMVADVFNEPDAVAELTSGGTYDYMKAMVNDDTITVEMHIADPDIDFSILDEETSEGLLNDVAMAFLQGIFGNGEDEDSKMVVGLLIATDTKIDFVFLDPHGHRLSKLLDFGAFNEE